MGFAAAQPPQDGAGNDGGVPGRAEGEALAGGALGDGLRGGDGLGGGFGHDVLS